jgi:adenylate kinase family enzyme
MFKNTIFGLIYIIKHKTCDDKKVYVGSTNDLKRRIKSHRFNCNNEKNKNYNNKLYQYIRENGGFYMYEILILECYACNFKHELFCKEDDYIKMYPNNLNQLRAYLSRQEYKKKDNEQHKKYYDENKDIICEKQKIYYEENKDKVKEKVKKYRENNKEYFKKYYENNKEKLKEKITCECGSIVRKNTIIRHCKSLKHIAFIEQKNNVIL